MREKAKVKIKPPQVPPEEFGKALAWAKEPDTGPDFVRNVILALEGAQVAGEVDAASARRAVEAMARAMGIIPSSERVSRKAPPAEPVEPSLAALIGEEKKLKALLRYVGSRLKATRRNIAGVMRAEQTPAADSDGDAPSTETVLAGSAGSGHEPVEAAVVATEESTRAMGPGTIETDTRSEKQDLFLDHRPRVILGKKYYNPTTGKTLAPDLSQVGPKGRRITWRALANVTVLIFGMAMPTSRIEKLFGKKGFSRSSLSDHCGFVAERLLPVYVAMAKSIAQCEVIMGDDCVSRVSDLTRYNRDLKDWKARRKKAEDDAAFTKAQPPPEPPWRNLPKESLTRQLEKELDLLFENAKADKEKTPKLRLHTSLLTAELVTGDPKTRVVLYRSHLGSVGNLLSKLLLSRKCSKDSLVFVGDLSASNHVISPEVTKHIKVTYAGCASHARRPFKRHLESDPSSCIDALDYFRALFHIEELIADRRQHLKSSIRAESSLAFWQELKELCTAMSAKWSSATPLGEGARYLLENYDSLTRYCFDERLPLSNDLSERMLRYEKLMDRSSFGRETVEGRARYDIIRSFWQSCVSAGVDPTYALLDVLLTSPETVSSRPNFYTPQEIAARLRKDPERCAHIDKILHTPDLASLVTYKLTDPNVPQDDEPA